MIKLINSLTSSFMLVCYLDIYLNHVSLLTNYAFVSMNQVFSNTASKMSLYHLQFTLTSKQARYIMHRL